MQTANLQSGDPRHRSRPDRSRVGIDWAKQPLGEVSDTELARKLHVTVESVRAARKCRGIERVPASVAHKQRLAREREEALEADIPITPPSDLREILSGSDEWWR